MRWPWSRRKAANSTTATATATASSPYFVLGGRKMAIDAPYMLPKDLEESGRLDFQHVLLRNILKGNYLAPIGQPLSILDVGCGTGRWGSEMARQFPRANVVGLDLAPPSVTSAAVTQGQERPPDNYVFVQGDVTKGLPFADNSFDFVHQRLVVMGLPYAQWLPAIQELRRVTRTGGWVELVDTTVTARSPHSEQWVQWAQKLASFRGIDMTAGNQIGNFLQQAGFRNVQLIPLEIPLGPWGGRIGTLMMADGMSGARALETPVVHQAHLATKEEFDAAVAAMEHDFATMTGCTQPFYIAYGQK
jgi:ubiquinone/menaquinone biosynthesis C-methylase UbiE